MPVSVQKREGMFRVVEANGTLATNSAGTPVDGGGFRTEGRAERQAAAINASKRDDEERQRRGGRS